ncbi:four helix bundle protein [Vibrio europaeus]|uniref:four helix bundle protein n=1 Tax=Vibrio europaeus TaxID=300876 RepID=UPI00233F223B|nr:four helix bundle protein [Vibrio europaeus]MDC5703471.1 four helix bundle protein [Vibrio europaeus]MDC5711374.1 four helix bundle protein [Vibrio europaeus]MDC5714867.1 four helix bundle protein [Vibrio europaeus]
MKYQNLHVWQISFELCKQVYPKVNHISDYSFRDQIRRSCISISSNIAEGMERESNKETAYFLSVAKGSTGELNTQLLLAAEFGYISLSDRDKLCEQCHRIAKILPALIRKFRT